MAMNLIRWAPFTGVDEIFARMPEFTGRFPRLFENGGKLPVEWSPAVDISETENEYLIKADLPAVKKEDVRITIDERLLTISGERRQKNEEKDEKSHRVETIYGRFARSFSLPDNADADAIRAESKDGVITVHIGKARREVRKPTEIKVQ
jgi:HSP20 family protein